MTASRPGVITIFFWCNDVTAMRRFYSELLGLAEHYGGDEAVSYELGSAEMFFIKARTAVPVHEAWAAQPAFTWERQEGTAYIPSWVVEVGASDFGAIIDRLKSAGVAPYGDPIIRDDGHRQFFVKDPMGNTVEIYSAPPTRKLEPS